MTPEQIASEIAGTRLTMVLRNPRLATVAPGWGAFILIHKGLLTKRWLREEYKLTRLGKKVRAILEEARND